jgi:hypothetical protein
MTTRSAAANAAALEAAANAANAARLAREELPPPTPTHVGDGSMVSEAGSLPFKLAPPTPFSDGDAELEAFIFSCELHFRCHHARYRPPLL